MAIQQISIDITSNKEKKESVLNDQFWPENGILHTSLNIIASKNGGGKSTLLSYIAKKYEKKMKVYKIATSIENFRGFEKVEDYIALTKKEARPPQVRQYKIAYETILTLPSRISEGIVEQCNTFLKDMSLDIRLDGYYLKTGRLCFQHNQLDENARVDVMALSSGEKTAFVLWLISVSSNKPDVLLLDEFDSNIDEESIDSMYYTLMDIAKTYGIQIFIASHRLHRLMFETERDGRYNAECGKWIIRNGIIKRS